MITSHNFSLIIIFTQNMEESIQQPTKNNIPTVIGAVVILGVIVLGVVMVSSGKNTEVPAEKVIQEVVVSVAPEKEAAEPAESMIKDEVKIITIEAGSFYFKPNEIRVKQGQRVRVVMNSVSMMHDFVIDELSVRLPIVKNGDAGTIEFVADKIGTFEYYCSVGQHRANGQVGTLIVE